MDLRNLKIEDAARLLGLRVPPAAAPAAEPVLRYRMVNRTDGLHDLMQVLDGRDLCTLDLRLAPETAALFAAAPVLVAALRDLCIAHEGHPESGAPVWIRARAALRAAGEGA